MVLDDKQNDLFFDTMDALLYYVNERFHVVRDLVLESESMIDGVKGSLVAQELWRNVEIIDDFVRENKYHLRPECLSMAASWKYALPGTYTLVRYQSGRALLMSDAGVFSVCGVTYELEGEIGPAPAQVDTVLIPFGDVIVYDGFLQAFDLDGGPDALRRVQDEFEERCANGIVATGSGFIARARDYLEAQRDKEWDALLESVALEAEQSAVGESLPDGFHRSPLADLDDMARSDAAKQHMDELMRRSKKKGSNYDIGRAHVHEPLRNLADCLSLYPKADLETIANTLYIGGLSRLRKAEMVSEIVETMTTDSEPLEDMLVEVADDIYETTRKAYELGGLTFTVDECGEYESAWPLVPYTFMFHGVDGYEIVIPEELKPVFASIDFESIDRERRRRAQVYTVAASCVSQCGIMSIDDAYDQYRALCSDALGRDEFLGLLNYSASFGDALYELWDYEPKTYLIHYTLSSGYAAQQYLRASGRELQRVFQESSAMQNVKAAQDMQAQVVFDVRDGMKKDLEKLEEYRKRLVRTQEQFQLKPLTPRIFEVSLYDDLRDKPSVRALRSFLDARVPDGKDDYVFVDSVIDEVVRAAVEVGSYDAVMAYLKDVGFTDCCVDVDRLPKLVGNVLDAMPLWDNNGWSAQELYEQFTGRKMFYNEDGSTMRVGLDDPCPCGSGLKYRDCCGR